MSVFPIFRDCPALVTFWSFLLVVPSKDITLNAIKIDIAIFNDKRRDMKLVLDGYITQYLILFIVQLV